MSAANHALPLRFEAPLSEEARWVGDARRGDAEATLQLLRRHRPPLVRLLTGITGEVGLAEDAAQEALLTALRRLGQLRDPNSFYPWVRRMAVRQALRAARRRRESPGEQFPEAPAAADPQREAMTRLAVHEALRRLPPELRATLVLREMEQLDYAEIAQELDIPIGTVRSRLYAARERFRQAWLESEEH